MLYASYLENEGWVQVASSVHNLLIVWSRPLVNEYNSGYGAEYAIFALNEDAIRGWVKDNLDGPCGKPYWMDRGLWDQCRVHYVLHSKWNMTSSDAERETLISWS